MKYKLFRLAALVLAIGCARVCLYGQTTSGTANSLKASKTALSAAEQDVLNEINQARLHPSEYVSYLEALKPLFRGREYTPKGGSTQMTNEGWAAVEDAIRFLRAAKPKPPLDISHGLCLAALAHVKDQSATGATGHKGAKNDMIEDRLKVFGVWQGGVGENLSYGNESARERVLAWLIDDGVSSRGHRTRLLSADYKLAGLSCGPHPEYGIMCVITFAGGFVELKTQTAASTETKVTTSTQTKTAPNAQTKPTSAQKPKTKRTARRW